MITRLWDSLPLSVRHVDFVITFKKQLENLTEQKNIDIVTVKCSVLTYGRCRHTVMWMKNGQIWAVNNTSAKITQSTCSATATFLTYHEVYKSKYEFLSCSVTEISSKEHLFSFYPLSPSKSKKTGKNNHLKSSK